MTGLIGRRSCTSGLVFRRSVLFQGLSRRVADPVTGIRRAYCLRLTLDTRTKVKARPTLALVVDRARQLRMTSYAIRTTALYTRARTFVLRRAATLICEEILKAAAGKLGVPDPMLNRAVLEVRLNGVRVGPLVDEREAAGGSQHLRDVQR